MLGNGSANEILYGLFKFPFFGFSLAPFPSVSFSSAFTPFQIKILCMKAVLKTQGRAVSAIDIIAGVLEEVPCWGTKA